jgi:predicted NBD/HSP70 family sugar kinase
MKRIVDPEWPVLHAILAQGAFRPTHDDIAELTGVSDRAISNVVSEFARSRLVKRGHPARLGPGLGLGLGISLGIESLRGVLVDANGDSYHELEEEPDPKQLHASPDTLFARIRRLVVRLLTSGLKDQSLWGPVDGELRLVGVAIAWPCPIDRSKRPVGRILRDGAWRRSSSAPGEPPSLIERLAIGLGDPFNVSVCHAVNDVSAAALTVAFDESRRRARERDDERWRVGLIVRVGGGLGAATIMLAPNDRRRLSFIDSRLIEGTNGLAGELGHLPIGRRVVEEISANSHEDLAPMQYDSWKCSCSQLHHLEAFASGAAVVRRLRASGYELPETGPEHTSLLRSALEGELDDAQIGAVTDAGRILGRALAGPILMLDPYSITLTGSLASDYLVDGIGRERDMWRNAIKDVVKVERFAAPASTRARFIGARGAALAVVRRVIYRGFLDGHRFPRPLPFGPRELERLSAV